MMNILSRIAGLFWNQQDNRLRMFWRTIIFGSLLSILVVLSSAVLGFSFILSDTFSLSFVVLFCVLAAAFMIGKWVDRRRFSDFGIVPSPSWWKEFFFGLALGALLMGLIFLTGWAADSLTVEGYFRGSFQGRPFYLEFLKSIGFYVAVGIYEELMLRGYILVNLAEGLKIKKLDKKWALLISLLISSLIFGLLHIFNPGASWISTLNISLAGVFLGLGMVLTGRLGLPIGLHITWNLFQGNVFGFPVSGANIGATLIETKLTGPEWLTGGKFGPEAGVLGLLGMAVGSIIILLWLGKRNKISVNKDLTEYKSNFNMQ